LQITFKKAGAPIVMHRRNVKPIAHRIAAKLELGPINCKAFLMSEDQSKNMSREERLAAKLRENLRRRKAQAREMGDSDGEDLSKTPDGG
jgi:hypothetical protein